MTGDGLLVVDKPAWWTSHQVVGRCRRLLGTRKVGHAGTLDPLATGVLVVGVNRATRLLGHLSLHDKRYLATVRLGIETLTEDADGEVTRTRGAAEVSETAVREAMAGLVGDQNQVPSAVSAIKVDGRRSYARVRAGEDVVLAARPVTVSRFDLLALRRDEIDGSVCVDLDDTLIGGGVALVVWHLVPAQPDLADALARLDPRAPTNQIAVTTDGDGHERLGRWAMRLLPPRVWGRIPTADLAVLRMSLSHFYGEKVLFLLVGVMILPAFTVLLSALGHPLPVAIPAAGSLVLGAVMFRLPNHNVTDEAKKAREEFRRALAAYYELVALERLGGAAHRQAMVDAATVADSWIFGRIREELALGCPARDVDPIPNQRTVRSGASDEAVRVRRHRSRGRVAGSCRRAAGRPAERGPGPRQHRRGEDDHPRQPDRRHLRPHPARPAADAHRRGRINGHPHRAGTARTYRLPEAARSAGDHPPRPGRIHTQGAEQ